MNRNIPIMAAVFATCAITAQAEQSNELKGRLGQGPIDSSQIFSVPLREDDPSNENSNTYHHVEKDAPSLKGSFGPFRFQNTGVAIDMRGGASVAISMKGPKVILNMDEGATLTISRGAINFDRDF